MVCGPVPAIGVSRGLPFASLLGPLGRWVIFGGTPPASFAGGVLFAVTPCVGCSSGFWVAIDVLVMGIAITVLVAGTVVMVTVAITRMVEDTVAGTRVA